MTDQIEDPSLDDDFEPEQEISEPIKPAKSGVGLKTVLLCSAVASILGMLGGAFLAQNLVAPGSSVVAEVSQADLDDVRSALDGLASRTTKLETRQATILKTQKASGSSTTESKSTPAGAADMAEFSAELLPLFEDVENRLSALESSSVPPNADQETVAGTDDETEMYVVPVIDNSEEINALTASVANLEGQFKTQSKTYVSKADLQALKRRVAKLEADFEKPPVLIPPFPREAVMDVLTGKTDENGGWLSGLLGDEVRVVDAETVMRLDRIEKFVEAGDINAIKKELVYLPTDAKPVIDDWLAQFEQSE